MSLSTPFLALVLFAASNNEVSGFGTAPLPARASSTVGRGRALGISTLQDFFRGNTVLPTTADCKARELVRSLVEDEKCFSTEEGALKFSQACASDIIFEDCYEPNPISGKTVSRITRKCCCYSALRLTSSLSFRI